MFQKIPVLGNDIFHTFYVIMPFVRPYRHNMKRNRSINLYGKKIIWSIRLERSRQGRVISRSDNSDTFPRIIP